MNKRTAMITNIYKAFHGVGRTKEIILFNFIFYVFIILP